MRPTMNAQDCLADQPVPSTFVESNADARRLMDLMATMFQCTKERIEEQHQRVQRQLEQAAHERKQEAEKLRQEAAQTAENAMRLKRQLKEETEKLRQQAAQAAERLKRQLGHAADQRKEETEKLKQQAAQAAEKVMRLERQLEQEADKHKEDTEKLRQEAAQHMEEAAEKVMRLEQEADERKEDTQALRQEAAQAAEEVMRLKRQVEQHAARLRLLDQHEFAYSTRCALIQALCIAIVRHNAEEETKLSVPGQHGREDMVEAVARLTSPEAVEATVVKSHGAEEDRRKQVSFATAALGRHILNAFRDGSASSFPPWVATVCAEFTRTCFAAVDNAAWWRAWDGLETLVSARHTHAHPRVIGEEQRQAAVATLAQCDINLRRRELGAVLASVYSMEPWEARHNAFLEECASRQEQGAASRRAAQEEDQPVVQAARREDNMPDRDAQDAAVRAASDAFYSSQSSDSSGSKRSTPSRSTGPSPRATKRRRS